MLIIRKQQRRTLAEVRKSMDIDIDSIRKFFLFYSVWYFYFFEYRSTSLKFLASRSLIFSLSFFTYRTTIINYLPTTYRGKQDFLSYGITIYITGEYRRNIKKRNGLMSRFASMNFIFFLYYYTRTYTCIYTYV